MPVVVEAFSDVELEARRLGVRDCAARQHMVDVLAYPHGVIDGQEFECVLIRHEEQVGIFHRAFNARRERRAGLMVAHAAGSSFDQGEVELPAGRRINLQYLENVVGEIAQRMRHPGRDEDDLIGADRISLPHRQPASPRHAARYRRCRLASVGAAGRAVRPGTSRLRCTSIFSVRPVLIRRMVSPRPLSMGAVGTALRSKIFSDTTLPRMCNAQHRKRCAAADHLPGGWSAHPARGLQQLI